MMLEIRDLSSFYGEVQALREFSLSVEQGEVMCLLGRNGAGKSTLLKSIMRLVDTRSGSINFQEQELTLRPAHEIAALGVGFVPQGRRLFSDLSVRENLLIGQMARKDVEDQLPRIFSLFPILKQRLKQRAGTLSGGEQQMLATARALCLDPKLLLLDEPTEGLQPSMIANIRAVILELKQSGVTTIVVEQRVDAVLEIADRVAFVENGQNRDVISAQILRADHDIVNRYVGVGN